MCSIDTCEHVSGFIELARQEVVVTKNSNFTDKERAAWHEARRHGSQGNKDAGISSMSSDNCINCGAPLGRRIRDGYEAALCDACE